MGGSDPEDLFEPAKPGKLERARRSTWLRNAGWAIIAALVLAGSAGLFGSGPLGTTTRSAGSLMLEFSRFVRRGTQFTLRTAIRLPAEASRAKLSLSASYLKHVRIDSLMPPPVEVVAGPSATMFVFAVEHGAPALAVSIHGEASAAGLLEGRLAAEGSEIEFTQFVWP